MELPSFPMQNYHDSVQIETDDKKGRKLVATAAISAGTDVLIESPLAFSLQYDEWKTRCHWCFRAKPLSVDAKTPFFIDCEVCGVARYCSPSCQRQAETSHEHECPALLAGTRPQSDVDRTLAGLLRALHDAPASTKEEFNQLFQGRFDAQTRGDFRRQLPTIFRLLGDRSSQLQPAEQCIDVFCRYLINSFLIMTDSMARIGMGFYLKAALMNHSCYPNCWTMFTGTTVHIRTLRDVAPGEELTISYIELNQSRAERQKDLTTNYFFECTCERCEREAVNETASIVSPKAQMSLLKAKAAVHAARDAGNLKQCKSLALDLLMEQEDVLNEHDSEITETLNILIKTCELLKHWNGAKQHRLKKLEISRACYPKVHPELAFQLLQLGKIELINQDTADAVTHLKECLEMLSVTHGDGELTKTVRQYIEIAALKQKK